MSKITIRDLARRAGVSPMTVSHALRGTGRVGEEKRAEIKALARRLDYRVDPIIAAGLAQMRRSPEVRFQSSLAVIEAVPTRDFVPRHATLGAMLHGAHTYAKQIGYKLDRFWFNDPDLSPARLKRVLASRGINGALVVFLQDRESDEQPVSFDFDLSDLACASLSTELPVPGMNFAMSDHFNVTTRAMLELRRLGYERIGLVCSRVVDVLSGHRFGYAYHGCQTEGMQRAPIPVFDAAPTSPTHYHPEIPVWIERHRLDAVVGWLLPSMLEAHGLRVPADVGVAHLDRTPSLAQVAGVEQNHEAVGAAAVQLVVGQLSNGERGLPKVPTAVMVEGRWVHGPTVRPMSTIPASEDSRLRRQSSEPGNLGPRLDGLSGRASSPEK